MKRKLAGLLALVMSVSIMAFSGTALAEDWKSKETFTIKKGEEENIRIPGLYGSVNWAKVEPAGVVIIKSAGIDGIDVEAVRPGMTTMSISSTSTDENGKVLFHTGTMNITVSDADGNVLGTTMGAHDMNKAVNYRVEVGKTISAATHSSISGTPTVSPSNILTVKVESVQTAANAQVASITGGTSSSGKALSFTGVSPGLATVVYSYQDAEHTSNQRASITVEVVAAGSMSDGTAAKTQNITLTKGSKSKLAQNYYDITSVTSSSDSVVKATRTGSAGGMNIELDALKAGTSTIIFNYKTNNASEVLKQSTIVVTVREDSNVSSLADTESGIYLTPRKSNAKAGKSYRTNLTVNGKEMDKDAEVWDDYVWISTNTSVATIDSQTGWFKTAGKGTTKIVCISKDGTMMDAVTVTVK